MAVGCAVRQRSPCWPTPGSRCSVRRQRTEHPLFSLRWQAPAPRIKMRSPTASSLRDAAAARPGGAFGMTGSDSPPRSSRPARGGGVGRAAGLACGPRSGAAGETEGPAGRPLRNEGARRVSGPDPTQHPTRRDAPRCPVYLRLSVAQKAGQPLKPPRAAPAPRSRWRSAAPAAGSRWWGRRP